MKKLMSTLTGMLLMTFPATIHVHLLPYIEQDNLYKSYLTQQGGGGSGNAIVSSFNSPSDESTQNQAGVQNLAANLRVFSGHGFNTRYDAVLPPLAKVGPGPEASIRDIGDGTSNTIAFATKYAVCGEGGSLYAAAPSSPFAAFVGQNPAAKPAHPSDATATFQLRPGQQDCLVSPLLAQSFGTSGLSVALLDGSVRMIDPTMSAETWNRAMQPNDGLKMGTDW